MWNYALFMVVILIWMRMHKNIKESKINFKYVYINYLVLIVLSIFLFPPVYGEIKNYVSNYESYLQTALVIYLLYSSFLNELTTAYQQNQIEKLARDVSLLTETKDYKEK